MEVHLYQLVTVHLFISICGLSLAMDYGSNADVGAADVARLKSDSGLESDMSRDLLTTSHDSHSTSRDIGSKTADSSFKLRDMFSIDRKLIFYKLFYFGCFGGISTVVSYLAIFLKQQGLDAVQVGVLFGLRSVAGFISGPLFGSCADQYGRRRLVLMVCIVAWTAFCAALYHVPSPTRITTCPRNPQSRRVNPAFDIFHRNTRELIQNQTSDMSPSAMRADRSWLYQADALKTVCFLSFFLVIFGHVFESPSMALSDAGTLRTLGTGRLDEYGAQRAWGAVGWGIRYVGITTNESWGYVGSGLRYVGWSYVNIVTILHGVLQVGV